MVNTDKRIEFLMNKFNIYFEDEIDGIKGDMEADGYTVQSIDVKHNLFGGEDKNIAIVFSKYKHEEKNYILKKIYISSDIFTSMLNSDPSKNKMYLQWMLSVFTKYLKNNKIEDAIRFSVEDLEIANEYLVLFDGNKRKKLFKELCSTNYATKHMNDPSDINQYSSLSELFDAVDPFIEKNPSDLMRTMERFVENGQAEIPVTDRNYTVFVPLTRDASTLFGPFASWCTTSDGNGMFASYTNRSTPISDKSKLYIVLENKFLNGEYDGQSLPNNALFQIHFESGQFKDRSNSFGEIDFYSSVLQHSNSLRRYFHEELIPMAKHHKSGNSTSNPYVKHLISFGYSDILFDLLNEESPTINFMNERIPLLPNLDRFNNTMSIFIGKSGLEEISDSICKLKKLEILSLPDNKLKKIPSSIGLCKNLEFINLVGNKISEIPDSISALDKSNGGKLEWVSIRKKDIGEDVFNKLKELLPNVEISDNALQ